MRTTRTPRSSSMPAWLMVLSLLLLSPVLPALADDLPDGLTQEEKVITVDPALLQLKKVEVAGRDVLLFFARGKPKTKKNLKAAFVECHGSCAAGCEVRVPLEEAPQAVTSGTWGRISEGAWGRVTSAYFDGVEVENVWSDNP